MTKINNLTKRPWIPTTNWSNHRNMRMLNNTMSSNS